MIASVSFAVALLTWVDADAPAAMPGGTVAATVAAGCGGGGGFSPAALQGGDLLEFALLEGEFGPLEAEISDAGFLVLELLASRPSCLRAR